MIITLFSVISKNLNKKRFLVLLRKYITCISVSQKLNLNLSYGVIDL
ncbi:MAG: hypothetical protein KatS3mg089_0806 [Patescibacteria group bacterium]|nr:MAG: hypothetical protein KatS3mg089_0806 [Patescibacteria group bacterium]